MAKIEIDNKLMWETAIRLYRQITGQTVGFDKALEGMGLCYKDGEITTIEPEPKKCLFTKDHYTDEERKELCEGCQEECELNKNIPMFKEVERNGKDELTDFESEIAHILVYVNNEPTDTDKERKAAYQKYAKNARFFAPLLLDKARKQIASEIDVDAMMSEYKLKEISPGLPAWMDEVILNRYHQGIEATIKKIKGEITMVYEDKKNIEVGNKYHYVFSIYTEEGFGECDITITYIRSGVIFYTVDEHPEMAEGHFEINSYMAEHLELIN